MINMGEDIEICQNCEHACCYIPIWIYPHGDPKCNKHKTSIKPDSTCLYFTPIGMAKSKSISDKMKERFYLLDFDEIGYIFDKSTTTKQIDENSPFSDFNEALTPEETVRMLNRLYKENEKLKLENEKLRKTKKLEEIIEKVIDYEYKYYEE